MANETELRDWKRNHLASLLRLKKAYPEAGMAALQSEIDISVIAMDNDDIAWVEKVVGAKAL